MLVKYSEGTWKSAGKHTPSGRLLFSALAAPPGGTHRCPAADTETTPTETQTWDTGSWESTETGGSAGPPHARPRPSVRVCVILGRVEVEAQRGQVRAQGQVHHARVRLCGADERQQADHSKLVRYHANRDVGHSSC